MITTQRTVSSSLQLFRGKKSNGKELQHLDILIAITIDMQPGVNHQFSVRGFQLC